LNQAHQPIVGRLCLPLAILALSGATLAQSTRPQLPPAQPNSDAKLPAPVLQKTPSNVVRPSHSTSVVLPPKVAVRNSPHSNLQNELYIAQPGDGATWARTMTYKARFDEQGFTYIPYLGKTAPQNYPLSMHVTSVTAGGQQVGFRPDVAPTQNGHSISFQRSGFTEIYDLTSENIEQSFTFQSLPASGDLVIRMDVDSELAARQTSDGFEFGNALGSVRYGHATVIDAAGHSTPTTTTLA